MLLHRPHVTCKVSNAFLTARSPPGTCWPITTPYGIRNHFAPEQPSHFMNKFSFFVSFLNELSSPLPVMPETRIRFVIPQNEAGKERGDI